MDISQYGDFDTLPILPEHETIVVNQLVEMYSKEPIADKVVDSTTQDLKGLPLKQQQQS